MQISISKFSGILQLCLLLTFATADMYLKEKPDIIVPCLLGDPGLNKCMARNLENMLVHWKDGLPGTNTLGPLDPLHIKRVSFSQKDNNVIALNSDMRNVVVRGASKLKVKEVDFNSDKHMVKALVFAPKLTFSFDYKAKGHVLALQIDGQGKGQLIIENINMLIDFGYKPRITPDASFSDVEHVKISFPEIGNFRIKLENLFNGNKQLEEIAHAIFNDNWREFHDIMGPAAEKAIEAVMLDRAKKIFAYVPANFIISNFH